MDWLSEYVSWCKSFANSCTEINTTTTDYSSLANAVGGSNARCFIDKDDNLWITTPHPQSCMKSRMIQLQMNTIKVMGIVIELQKKEINV